MCVHAGIPPWIKCVHTCRLAVCHARSPTATEPGQVWQNGRPPLPAPIPTLHHTTPSKPLSWWPLMSTPHHLPPMAHCSHPSSAQLRSVHAHGPRSTVYTSHAQQALHTAHCHPPSPEAQPATYTAGLAPTSTTGTAFQTTHAHAKALVVQRLF